MALQRSFYELIKRLYYKDPISNDLKSFRVYKFTCATCSSNYYSETCHFKTRIAEHIKKGSNSHIFYTPLQHALTHVIIFVLKQLIKLALNSTEKLKNLDILIGENLTQMHNKII